MFLRSISGFLPSISGLRRSRGVLPGFGLSLGVSLFFISLVLLLPVGGLLMQAGGMSWEQYWRVITEPRTMASYRVTLVAATIATVFNALFGMLLAWVLARYEFTGKRMLDALVDLPFALPTAVAGVTLAALFSANGWYGQFLSAWDIKVSYTPLGIIVAMAFTSVPFVVRTVQPVLEDLPREDEEAAVTLGASGIRVFWQIIMPCIWPAWLTGTALSFVRSLGEFGAIIFIAGNMPYISEVTSLMIFVRLQEYDLPAATAVASVVLVVSLLFLLAIQFWQSRVLAWQRR